MGERHGNGASLSRFHSAADQFGVEAQGLQHLGQCRRLHRIAGYRIVSIGRALAEKSRGSEGGSKSDLSRPEIYQREPRRLGSDDHEISSSGAGRRRGNLRS